MTGLRLTRRGGTVLVWLLLATVAASCVLAYTTGERWRCERLTAAHAVSAVYYCPPVK